MSDVPSGERGENPPQLRVKEYCIDLRTDLTEWVLRDFATDGKLEVYQKVLLESTRNEVIEDCRNLASQIEMANSIHMKTELDYANRRMHIQHAIGYCNRVKVELNFIVKMYHSLVNVNKYMTSIKKADKEISALKSWRHSCDTAWMKEKKKGNL